MRYICDPHIVPTVVPRTLAEITTYAQQSAEYADTLHVDIADGKFAPNTTWPFALYEQEHEVNSFARLAQIPASIKLEAHLMVERPEELGMRLARAGFSAIAGHIESFQDADAARAALRSWKGAGAAAVGLAILIDTPLENLNDAIDACDFVQVMSVKKIGAQGQPFDDQALLRVEELHAMYPDLLVSVDGGVTEATVEALARAGANKMTVGAAISRAANPGLAYAKIHERAMLGCAPLSSESAV